MHWLKTLVLFAALLCGSNAFSTTICPSMQIYKEAKTTYFPFSPVNQLSSPAILYGNSAPNCFITNQNLEVSPANQHNQQSRNNKYRLGRKRWKNAAFRSFTPLPASEIRNFFIPHQFNREISPNSNQPYSTHLPDALVISIHRLSNVIEPLK